MFGTNHHEPGEAFYREIHTSDLIFCVFEILAFPKVLKKCIKIRQRVATQGQF